MTAEILFFDLVFQMFSTFPCRSSAFPALDRGSPKLPIVSTASVMLDHGERLPRDRRCLADRAARIQKERYSVLLGPCGTLTYQQSLSPTGLGYLPSPYSIPGVKYGAGLNLIQIQTDGAITAISTLTLNGSPATLISTPGGGDVVQTWAVAKGSASTAGVLETAYTGSRNKFTIMIATLNGTKASPLTILAVVLNSYHSSPTQNPTSAPCPTGGIIVGFGAGEPTIIGPVAGATRIDPGGDAFGVYRKISGFVGVEHNNEFFSLNSFIFEK